MSPTHTPAPEVPEQVGLISPARAAAMLTVSAMTLGQWRRKGFGPAFIQLAPRVFRYRLVDVTDYISRGVANPSAKVVVAAGAAGLAVSPVDAREGDEGMEGVAPTE